MKEIISRAINKFGRVTSFTGLVLVLALSLGCGSAAERDAKKFKQEDPEGFAAVQRMREKSAQGGKLTADELAVAKQLHQKYPAEPDLRRLLVTASQRNGDWAGVAALVEAIPAGERTREDQLTLGQAYLKLGRHAEASALVGPLAEAAPADVELNNLAGQAWFNLGDHNRAAAIFDRVWAGLIAGKQVDAVVERGLIYFYQGAHPKAIETLKQALQLDGSSIAANAALARVYSAIGDQQQASIHQQRAEQIHAQSTADEARAMRLVGLVRELEAAFRAQRYQDCVTTAQQVVALAPPATQATAYQYLAQCYQAQGNTVEAQKANEQATRLQQQR